MPEPSFVCLTNIPTPYRLFQFRLMHRELANRGWKFEVWFLAASEARRAWKFTEAEFDFPHRFLHKRNLRIGGDPLYFNPELPRLLRKTRPDVLLVAGAWIHPSVWMACMSSASQRTIFWSESHLDSMRKTGSISGLARTMVLSRFREFAVPGELAQRYVERYSNPARIFRLPNLVDPTVFFHEVLINRGAIPSSNGSGRRRVLLISARLFPEKGLIPFLDTLSLLNEGEKKSLSVRIAGSGPQLAALQRWIGAHDLGIHLLGQRTEAEMVKLYAEADGFCLPSILDPNPLSVIEALWAGLPLLLSSRVGNHPECLQDGRNGFLFDPRDPKSIAKAVSQWLALVPNELTEFGENSLVIAQNRFDPDQVICKFLDEVLADSRTPLLQALPIDFVPQPPPAVAPFRSRKALGRSST